MSSDEKLILRVARAAKRAGLEFILVGNAAAALLDAPVTTQDVDLFVRHTPRNLKKISDFARILGGEVTEPHAPLSRMLRIVSEEVAVDLVFQLSSRRRFESVRAAARQVPVGELILRVASLEDLIAAKEAAGRPKDRASLPILRATLAAQHILGQKPKPPTSESLREDRARYRARKTRRPRARHSLGKGRRRRPTFEPLKASSASAPGRAG